MVRVLGAPVADPLHRPGQDNRADSDREWPCVRQAGSEDRPAKPAACLLGRPIAEAVTAAAAMGDRLASRDNLKPCGDSSSQSRAGVRNAQSLVRGIVVDSFTQAGCMAALARAPVG